MLEMMQLLAPVAVAIVLAIKPVIIGLIVAGLLAVFVRTMFSTTIGLSRNGSELIGMLAKGVGIVVTLQLYNINIF